jgi:hypothetical protein
MLRAEVEISANGKKTGLSSDDSRCIFRMDATSILNPWKLLLSTKMLVKQFIQKLNNVHSYNVFDKLISVDGCIPDIANPCCDLAAL